jgi:hypothetical protein
MLPSAYELLADPFTFPLVIALLKKGTLPE